MTYKEAGVLTLEEAKKLFPKYISLTYVDREDDFENSPDLLQEAIQSGNIDCLYDGRDDWICDCEYDSVSEYFKDLKKAIAKEYPEMSDTDIELFIDEYREDLRDELYERNDSTPIDDMLRYTRDQIMFYDTGLESDADWDATDAEKRLTRMRIKKMLGINTSAYDAAMKELIENAFCGNLEIYFKASVRDCIYTEGIKSIQFKDPEIAIVSHGQGSGHGVSLKGHTVTLPFDKKHLFLENSVHYNYSNDICGMCSDWCEDTKVTFLKEEAPGTLKTSNLIAHMEQEAEYNKVFASGKCTYGDMNITRHRDTKYINEYPCGTHCPHCGTFWVD